VQFPELDVPKSSKVISDALKLNQFDLAIDEVNVDSAYDTLAHLIVNAASDISDANMIS